MTYPNSYIAWDLETSGLEPQKSKILEIGFIKVIEGEVTEKHSIVLDHGIEIPDEIQRITGITPEIIEAEGIPPAKAYEVFSEFVQIAYGEGIGANLTHNGIRFDIPFLLHHLELDDLVTCRNNLVPTAIDSAVLFKARELDKVREWHESFREFANRVMEIRAYGVKYNVAHCCEVLGIKVEGPLHRALNDVLATHAIYQELKLRGIC